jgi:hypothetical protein
LSKKISELAIAPASSADLLWLEVAREITAGNWNGISERIRVSTLVALLSDAGAAINLNLIQQLNPTGAAYLPTRTYTLYDYLDVPYQGAHYVYVGDTPSAGNAPPDPAYWVLISTDGATLDVSGFLTQTTGDARYPLKTATDPYPGYLTQAEAEALFSPVGNAPSSGLQYNLNLTTTFPAATGQVRLNNAAIASVTQINIHESDRNDTGNTGNMATILDAIAINTRIKISSELDEEIYAWFRVSAAPIDNGSDRTISVAFVSASGTFVAGEVAVSLLQIQGVAASSGGHVIEVNGTAQTQRAKLNIVALGATTSDDATGDRTTLNLPAGGNAGTGLTWSAIAANASLSAGGGYVLAAGVVGTFPTAPDFLQISVVNGSASDAYIAPPNTEAFKDPVLTLTSANQVKLAAFASADLIRANSLWQIFASRGDISAHTPSGYAAETISLQARFSGTYTTAQKNAQNALIQGLITDGLWALMDALYIFTAASQADALLNWKSTSFNASLTGGSFTAFSSLAGAVNTTFIPATNGVNYALGSAGFSLWATISGGNTNWVDAGSGTIDYLSLNNTFTGLRARCNTSSSQSLTQATTVATTGLISVSRNASTASGITIYNNGAAMAIATQSGTETGRSSSAFYFGSDTGGANASGRPMRFAALHAKLSATQAANLNTRLNTFFTAIGL